MTHEEFSDDVKKFLRKLDPHDLWARKQVLWIALLFCGARIIEAFRDAQIFENPVEARDWLWHLLKFPQYFSLLLMGYVTRKGWWFADWTERIVATAGILVSGWVVFETALKLWRKLL